MLLATIGLGLLVVVVVSSVVAVRRRLSYRVWHALHVSAYLAIALGFSHQLATGREFQGQPVARAYWWALYAVALGALVGLRLVLPVARSLRHRLRIERVVPEAPGIVSVEIGGVGLERLPVRAGQSLHWRFLARGHWWETHPFSLSAAPDGRRLRITVKDVGDYTRRLASLPIGTRVIIEGPSGGLTSAARRQPRVALIAGGVGIAPIRALLEDTPGEPGTIAVIYRAASEDDVLFRDELDELARRRGAELHYVLGERRGDELLSAEHLQALVPDIASRDVYVCGPPSMTEATRASLRRAGVSAPAHRQRRVRLVNGRVVARRAVPAAVATAAVVALLANVRARPPSIAAPARRRATAAADQRHGRAGGPAREQQAADAARARCGRPPRRRPRRSRSSSCA